MRTSRRHDAYKILEGQRKHSRPGELPRATGINNNPTHTDYELNTSKILGIFRDDDMVVLELEQGFYNVRTRLGMKWRNQLNHENDFVTKCPKEGWSAFKDDFTIKEVEFYLYDLMDNNKNLNFWLEESRNQVVIPTNLNNRPSDEYLNGHTLNIEIEDYKEIVVDKSQEDVLRSNKEYLNRIQVSRGAIARLERRGYLVQELVSNLDNSEYWVKIQAIIKDDKKTAIKRRKVIKGVKGDKVKLEKAIQDYFPEMGTFEVRQADPTIVYHWLDILKLFPRAVGSYKYLLIWDKNGKRIYHTYF